jgi:hypothetical protein
VTLREAVGFDFHALLDLKHEQNGTMVMCLCIGEHCHHIVSICIREAGWVWRVVAEGLWGRG